MNISDIATEIYQEINQPSDVSASTIIYWLASNIGILNLTIDTNFIVNVDNSTTPDMGETEKAIFKLLYERYYYNKQLSTALATASYGNPGAIVSVVEGNKAIKLVNGGEIAKTYQSVVSGLTSTLNALVQAYKMNANVPLEVIYEMRPAFPYLYDYALNLPPY